jgi:DNA-binding MarR family transcriptional regulator
MKQSPGSCVCATLRKATRSVTQIYDAALRPSGLRATQFYILAELQGSEATVGELARRAVLDQTTLTRSLALLERDGLVRPVPKPDARLKSVALTKKGEKTLAAALPLWSRAQKRTLAALGAEAWTALSADLDRLARLS